MDDLTYLNIEVESTLTRLKKIGSAKRTESWFLKETQSLNSFLDRLSHLDTLNASADTPSSDAKPSANIKVHSHLLVRDFDNFG